MKKTIRIALIWLFLAFPGLLLGAEFKFLTTTDPISVGDERSIDVVLSTAPFSANAVEAVIRIPEGLTVTRILDAQSTISLWITRPIFENGVISLSGVLAGGMTMEKAPIIRFVVKATKLGTATIDGEVTVLSADGEGTPIPVSVRALQLTVNQGDAKNADSSAEIVDTTPPLAFSVVLVRNDDAFGGVPVLIFATHDKETGIARYEMRERRIQTLWRGGAWQTAESPYPLERIHFGSIIEVRAVDVAGNATISKVSGTTFSGVIVPLIVVGLVCVGIIALRRKKFA